MIPSYPPQVPQPTPGYPQNPNYSNWINPGPAQPQPQPQPTVTEQRGITAVYMANSKNEYGTLIPPAGQTIAIFNFADRELVFKTRDIYGIDLNMRTFDISEKTTNQTSTPSSAVQAQAPDLSGYVSKESFDELSEKFNALYNELKG